MENDQTLKGQPHYKNAYVIVAQFNNLYLRAAVVSKSPLGDAFIRFVSVLPENAGDFLEVHKARIVKIYSKISEEELERAKRNTDIL